MCGDGVRAARHLVTAVGASLARRGDHDRLRMPGPPSRSPRPCSARRTTSNTSTLRRRRRRSASWQALEDAAEIPLLRSGKASRSGEAPVESGGRAEAWTRFGGSAPGRFALARRGARPGSVIDCASASTVRPTGAAPQNGAVAGSGATR